MRLKVPAGNPGSRPLKKFGQSGLGSLRKTMPHLKARFVGGGEVTELYASQRPRIGNAMSQAVMEAMRQKASFKGRQFVNPEMFAMPGSSRGYAAGGPAVPEPPLEDFEEVGPDGVVAAPPEAGMEALPPDDGTSGAEGLPSEGGEDMAAQQQIVIEAMLALEGRHPDPEAAIAAFIEAFGEEALAELQAMVQQQQQEPEPETGPPVPEGEMPLPEEAPPEPAPEEGGMDVDLRAAGGGLLRGKGSGQSDEIEGTTPSGRPVLLSDGEYVIDAATVSALGDGSTDAGARRLDDFRKSVRKQAYGHNKQAKPMFKGGAAIEVKLDGR